MTDQLTAYHFAVQLYEELGIPSFPVLLTQGDDSKWQKKPLVKWGGVKPDTHPSDFNWGRANAVGVPMGRRSGLFAFDIDSYKPKSKAAQWVQARGLPPTRTHRTASGGMHLIYRAPSGMRLGNSAPKVYGLDVRGDGGFIVWSDILGRYEVVDDRAPVDMPQKVIDLLAALNEGAGMIVRDADVPPPGAVCEEAIVAKLNAALNDTRNIDLRRRFWGQASGLKDRSRSAMDMSTAGLLARAGFTYDEIIAVLLHHFEHGKAGRDGWTAAVEREVCRCAHRAVTQRQKAQDDIRAQLETSLSGLSQRLGAPQGEGRV